MFKSKFIACLAVLCSIGVLAGCNPTGNGSSNSNGSGNANWSYTGIDQQNPWDKPVSSDAKKNLVQAFYDFTFSKVGLGIAKANGGIVTNATIAAAHDFTASKYVEFTRDNSAITITLGGSTSVDTVRRATVNAFKGLFTGSAKAPQMVENPSGSGAAVSGLKDGSLDIGYLSRELQASEQTDLASLQGFTGHFSIDAVVPIVNNSNNFLTNVTAEQLASVYGDETYLKQEYPNATPINTWGPLGGNASTAINKVTRDESSGTREAFMDKIGIPDAKDDPQLTKTGITQVPSNNDMVRSVSNDVNAIGYASLDSITTTSGVKKVNFEGVEATEETIGDGTYKMQRYFNIVAVF